MVFPRSRWLEEAYMSDPCLQTGFNLQARKNDVITSTKQTPAPLAPLRSSLTQTTTIPSTLLPYTLIVAVLAADVVPLRYIPSSCQSFEFSFSLERRPLHYPSSFPQPISIREEGIMRGEVPIFCYGSQHPFEARFSGPKRDSIGSRLRVRSKRRELPPCQALRDPQWLLGAILNLASLTQALVLGTPDLTPSGLQITWNNGSSDPDFDIELSNPALPAAVTLAHNVSVGSGSITLQLHPVKNLPVAASINVSDILATSAVFSVPPDWDADGAPSTVSQSLSVTGVARDPMSTESSVSTSYPTDSPSGNRRIVPIAVGVVGGLVAFVVFAIGLVLLRRRRRRLAIRQEEELDKVGRAKRTPAPLSFVVESPEVSSPVPPGILSPGPSTTPWAGLKRMQTAAASERLWSPSDDLALTVRGLQLSAGYESPVSGLHSSNSIVGSESAVLQELRCLREEVQRLAGAPEAPPQYS
ncbi:hypothetical protein C8J57DRAFT_1236065 [Mycena rebaudengoi]|nr:hypothetical protein C8J57DRAFT_1236065 [Mycena rebaudengoi]